MERIYKWICSGFLAAMILVMLIASFSVPKEHKPKLSVSSLLDGSYVSSAGDAFSQVFSANEMLQAEFEKLADHYRIGD